MNNKKEYWLMDERAVFDIDRAFVFRVCDSYDEAWELAAEYGDGVCVVDPKTQRIISKNYFCKERNQ